MRGRIAALICILSLLFAGCWDRIEVEDQMFVVTLGIDKGREHRYRVTARVPVVASLKSGILGGREGETPASELLVVEAASVQQAVLIMNTAVARRMTMRHLRALMIGEELAREGLQGLLAELVRNPEMRATAGVYIVRGKAEEAIRLGRWTGEYNAGRLTEGAMLVEKQLHMAPPIRLHHLVNRTGALGIQAFSAVVAVNRQVQAGEEQEGEGTGSALAGTLDRFRGNPVELAGTAIFRDSKLVGFLTVDETQALLALRGEMGKAYMTIPNPLEPGHEILMRFHQENFPKYQAWFVPEGPRVNVRVLFEGEVLSGDEHYRTVAVRRRVEESARKHMEGQMRGLLEKLAECEADPVGFGLLFRGKFATWSEWARYNWPSQIRRLRVQVSADMRIRRYGLILGAEQPLQGEEQKR